MIPQACSFRRGTLTSLAADRAKRALRAGALQPVPTEERFVADGGVRFVVRVMASLARKDAERVARIESEAKAGLATNPFLPYDADLFVADLSPTHLCLLNKFNVIDSHLLIVTRAFEDQETLLTPADWAAMALCLDEIDGLGFYNGGTIAGASQPHKHLQLVPLPLAPEGPPLPIQPLLDRAGGDVLDVPFRHAFRRWHGRWHGRWHERASADDLHRRYLDLVAAAGIVANGRLRCPYNVLVTRRWMLAVPRARERVENISINALGFAGSLFVRDAREMAKLERLGPMTMLRLAGLSPS